MKNIIYPKKYELVEVLSLIKNRAFLEEFSQSHGLFLTNSSLDMMIDEISNMFLDDADLEWIRTEAYRETSNQALSGFVVNSKSKNFKLPAVYNYILDNVELKEGTVINSLRVVPGNKDVFKGSLQYIKKRPGRIEFLQDEVSHFDFYFKDLGEGNWQVEVDSNRSTDIKELQKLLTATFTDEQNIAELDQKHLSTDLSIRFFDELAKKGMDSSWRFTDVKHLTLKKGSDKKNSSDDEAPEGIEEAAKEELIDITQAILEGKNLRENSFVKQSVANGYRFNAMTYEYQSVKEPYIISIKAEFKGRPKVFEVTISSYDESVGTATSRMPATLSVTDNREVRSLYWNNAKAIYNDLTKIRQANS